MMSPIFNESQRGCDRADKEAREEEEEEEKQESVHGRRVCFWRTLQTAESSGYALGDEGEKS